MRTIAFFIGLSLFLFFINPINTKAQSIEGCVTNGLTGDPLENVSIDCGPWTSITGSDGCYGFFLDPGTYNITCVYGDFCPFDTTITLVNNQAIQLDIQLYPCLDLIVDPISIEVWLEPNAQTTEIITISNPGETNVEWEAELEVFPPGSTDELFDLIFQMPLTGLVETGAETNGTYIYTTSPSEGLIYRYDMSGLFIGSFSLASGIYDLAYDGTHFFGSIGTTTIIEMDLDLEVMISTFNAPQNVKAITYNSDDEVFYGFNWGGDIIVFDQSGALLNAIPVGPNDPVYSSFAYDNVTSGAPYLWGYGLVDGDPNVLVQIALPSFQLTGISVSLSDILQEPVTNGAGGLFVSPDIVTGIFAIAGIVQGEWLWALELEISENSQWVSIEPTSGVLEPGESEEMSVYFDATDLFPWEYNAEIQFSTAPNVGSPIVELALLIEGQPGVMDMQSEYNCTNVFLEWETLPPGCMYVDSMHIYKDSLYYATTFECHFIDSMVVPETEHTYFATGYFFQGWESNPTNIIDVTIPLPDSLEPLNLDGMAFMPNENDVTLFWEEPAACLAPDFYNVYWDGELIDEGITNLEYVHTDGIPYGGIYSYNVTATYYFGESPYSNTFYIVIPGFEDKMLEELHLFPNPATDKLFIQSPVAINLIELLNIQGLLVLSDNSGSKEFQLDVSRLNPGIYVLKLKVEDEIIIRKVIMK